MTTPPLQFSGRPAAPSEIGIRCESRGLSLSQIAAHGTGLFTAVQHVSIGRRAVFNDSVVIEEVIYSTPAQMLGELNNFTIKQGAFLDCSHILTRLPKYVYPDVQSLRALFVSQTPRLSFDVLTKSVCRAFEPQLNWNHGAYLLKTWNQIVAVFSDRSHTKSTPLPKRLFDIPGKILSIRCRIARRDRLAFAARLCQRLYPLHKRKIYLNNISPKTLFFRSFGAPVFFASYSGVQSQILKDSVPQEILNDVSGIEFGPDFKDVYACAALCYTVFTGVVIDTRSWKLDSDTTSGPGTNSCVGINFRRLVQSTGGIWRGLPIIGSFADTWFPTQTARILRTILDKKHFDKMIKQPIDLRGGWCTKLLSAFKKQRSDTHTIFDAIVSTCIDHRNQTEKSTQAFASKPSRSHNTILLFITGGIVALIAAAIFIGLNFSAPKVIRPAAHGARPNKITEQNPTPKRPAALPTPVRKNSSRPQLEENKRFKKVYRFVNLGTITNPGQVYMKRPEGSQKKLGDQTDKYTKYFIAEKTASGYGPIVAVRICSGDNNCKKGYFYQAVGFSGFGDEIKVHTDDIFGFSYFDLYFFISKSGIKETEKQ